MRLERAARAQRATRRFSTALSTAAPGYPQRCLRAPALVDKRLDAHLAGPRHCAPLHHAVPYVVSCRGEVR